MKKVNKSASNRRTTREVLSGQLLLGTCQDDADMLFAFQRLIDRALAGRFGMLFTVFTRLNTIAFLSSRKDTVRWTRRAERILKKGVDEWTALENTRRRRYLRTLKLCQSESTDLQSQTPHPV